MTLKDTIDKDFFYIESISYSDKDLKKMSVDELETLKMKIQKKIDGISLSLKGKQSYIDTNSRKRALYINQRVLVYVSLLIKNQRQQKKTISEYFFEHARDILPIEQFDQILDEAEKSMKVQKGDHYEQ